MNQPPVISIIIPTYNRREILARTLPTVFDQDFPAAEYEVVVVVDGSTDGSSDFLRTLNPSCRFQVIEQRNGGQAVALNTGVKAATGRLVLRLDDDLLCDRSLVAEHVAGHAGGGFTLVFGRMRVAPESPWTFEAESMRADLESHYQRSARCGQPLWPYSAWAGPNCSLPRANFLNSGGYDGSLLRRFEDIELGLRLWKNGCHFKFQPKAVTYHLCLKSASESARDLAYEGRSLIALCRLHPEFRAHNALTRVVQGPLWKRLAYQTIARLPFSATACFTPFLKLTSRLAENTPWARRVGLRLHAIRKNVAWFQGAITELGSWNNFHNMFGRRLPVLMYHRIGRPAVSEYRTLTVTSQKFARQVKWLARHGYVAIQPLDWLAWCREGKPLPAKPVLLTFDDAYADLSEHALPVLKLHGFSATIFVVTQCLGKTNAWDLGMSKADLPLMTAEQVRYWADQGFEFGGHTCTHVNLTSVDTTKLAEEVEGSALDLEQILGKRATAFAYPYGQYNEAARTSAEKAFAMAFSTEEGINFLTTNPHLLKRIDIDPKDTLLDLWFRVHWGYSPLNDLREVLQIRTRLRSAVRFLTGKT